MNNENVLAENGVSPDREDDRDDIAAQPPLSFGRSDMRSNPDTRAARDMRGAARSNPDTR